MRRHLIGTLVLLATSFGVAHAQESTTGSFTGVVLDAQGAAVPGATVTVTSGQGSKSFVTDGNGRYYAPFLVPGKHDVTVELTGFSKIEQKGVQVRLGQRLELDFTLKVGEFTDVVEVIGTAPTVDQTSTTAGGTLDSDVLKMLPVARNFTGTLYMVPGVSDSSGVGNANPSIGGASGLENNYIVDGVNISNQGFGGVGVYSIVFGSLGTGVTTDFIKETQVKTAGFEAEFGQATGGVVNVVTKSGTNQFHGSLFGYFQPGSLEAERDDLQSPNGTVNTVDIENADFGITVGGPLVKDKLFFFGAFNPQYQTRTLIAPADQANFPLRSLGEVERKRRILSYAGKLTWQASANHRFDFTTFGDPSHGENGPQRNTALLRQTTSAFSELDEYGGDNQSLRYDGIITSNWLLEATVSRAATIFTEIPSVNEHRVTDTTVTPQVRTGGIGFFDQGSDGENIQLSLKSTHIFDAGGNHQFRYGVQFEDIEYSSVRNRTGPTFALPNGVQTRTGASVTIAPDPVFGRIYRVTRANFGDSPLTTQKYLNWFAQDTWRVGNRLTLKPGVRWERQRLVGGSPLCFEGESQVGAVGNGLEAATGAAINCEFTWSNNWSPRLAAIFDITGDGRSKVYASWGRFYAKIPNDLAARALSADAGVTVADYFDAALSQPVPNGTTALGTTQHFVVGGTSASLFTNDTKSSYNNEFVAGIEFEAARALNVGVRYIHRNLPVVLEDFSPAPAADYFVPGTNLSNVQYFIDNISPALQTTDATAFGIPRSAFEDPVHTYDAIEVTANKSFSDNWSLIASYRWSQLKGNFEGFFRSDNGQSDPSITSLFDFPTNDPSYTQIGVPQFGFRGDIRFQGDTQGTGRLPNDRPHQVKVFTTYSVSDVNVGIGFNAGSGRTLTALASNPVYQNSGEVPETLRGAGIQTADGLKERTDTEIIFDLHLDYTLRFGSSQRLILLADVFNVFDDQDPNNFDNFSETTFQTANPNFGLPTAGGGLSTAGFHAPRQIRFGARLEW